MHGFHDNLLYDALSLEPSARRPSWLAALQFQEPGFSAQPIGAGWSSPVARQAHNLKVAGSNPAPATKYLFDNKAKIKKASIFGSGLFAVLAHSWHTQNQSTAPRGNKSQLGSR